MKLNRRSLPRKRRAVQANQFNQTQLEVGKVQVDVEWLKSTCLLHVIQLAKQTFRLSTQRRAVQSRKTKRPPVLYIKSCNCKTQLQTIFHISVSHQRMFLTFHLRTPERGLQLKLYTSPSDTKEKIVAPVPIQENLRLHLNAVRRVLLPKCIFKWE